MWHLYLFLFQFYRLNRIKYRLSIFVPALPPHSFILRRTPIWHGGRKINDLCCTRFQQRFPLTFISYLEYCALLTHFHQQLTDFIAIYLVDSSIPILQIIIPLGALHLQAYLTAKWVILILLKNNLINVSVSKYDHISEYYVKLKWLSIRLRHSFAILYSTLFLPHSPPYLTQLFEFLHNSHCRSLKMLSHSTQFPDK